MLPVLLIATGCSTHVSRDYGFGYGHHTHISVGGHGHSSGAKVAGALLIGGIIGSIITNEQHKNEHQDGEMLESSAVGKTDQFEDMSEESSELVGGYSLDTPQTQSNEPYAGEEGNLTEQTDLPTKPQMNWYQYGKDGHCYLMSVTNGITDIVSAVPSSQCN